ncbi:PQQ-binding-like beta-propeller repeat protein [Devosia sp.]|uniref:outer membrane protein assembly factor BamB family protein n=1 Tax=Devosia sp. TaxID=1871048 RepID=UPI002629D0FF|nr:PQQ-binding-like beta-propeller repeat protein [Devosia sp.]
MAAPGRNTRFSISAMAAILLASCAGSALAQDAAPAADAAPVADAGVTAQQLLDANSDSANWLMYNRTYDGQRFSPLDEINRDTVKGLKLAYTVALAPPTGALGNFKFAGLEGTPLVRDGHMYLTDGLSRVYKIDLTSGKRGTIEWIMDPQAEFAPGVVEPPNNKGVALLGNNVYSLSFDGRLTATDAETGDVVWEQLVQTDPKQAFTMSPLAIGNSILIGTANGDSGGRHWIQSRDATTGDLNWQFNTIPGPDEPGGDSWKDKTNNWENGGGAPWNTGTYDPATNVTYWGVGNPFPAYDPAARPGDNLYTNSLLALDATSGKLDWHFQYTPNDAWDYDEIGAHVLVDTTVDGESRKLVTHFGRNGFYYGIDRASGAFINGGQYVDKVTWTKGLDPKTGMPVEYDASLPVQTYIPTTRPGGLDGKIDPTCPMLQGGTNYFPVSYSPKTARLYAVAFEGCANFNSTAGATVDNVIRGSVVQLDPVTGQVTKKRATDFAPYGGVLATAGNVLFSSQIDGSFEAMDAETLDVLWSVNLGSQISAPPITYSVNGKQYVAIEVGASPIDALLGYTAKGADPDAAANMQATATVYFFAL